MSSNHRVEETHPKRILIIGSTRFAPLKDIEGWLAFPDAEDVFTWGISPVAKEVHRLRPDAQILTASANRDELVRKGRDCRVIAFVSRDPETKEISEGTRDNINLLETNGVNVEVVGSSLTSEQADAYHAVEVLFRKLLDTPADRSTFRINKLRRPCDRLEAICSALEDVLTEEDQRLRELDEQDDEGVKRWIRFLNRLGTMRALLAEVDSEIALRVHEELAA